MSYSANDNQNYFVADGRTTSRVQAQPGGPCSISLGGWTPEELERQRQLKEQREKMATTGTAVAASPNATVKMVPVPTSAGKENNESSEPAVPSPTVAATTVAAAIKPAESVLPAAATTAISSNAFASAASTNSFNVITDRPTSRVSRPPGGHTSIRLW